MLSHKKYLLTIFVVGVLLTIAFCATIAALLYLKIMPLWLFSVVVFVLASIGLSEIIGPIAKFITDRLERML